MTRAEVIAVDRDRHLVRIEQVIFVRLLKEVFFNNTNFHSINWFMRTDSSPLIIIIKKMNVHVQNCLT